MNSEGQIYLADEETSPMDIQRLKRFREYDASVDANLKVFELRQEADDYLEKGLKELIEQKQEAIDNFLRRGHQ